MSLTVEAWQTDVVDHRHLVRLASEHDADRWEQVPLTSDERSLAQIADWGPAEDWSDWADAAG